MQTMADTNSNSPIYELAITFEPEKKQLSGTAHISLEAGENLTLDLEGLEVSSIMLNRDKLEALAVKVPAKPRLYIPPSANGQDIFISYTKTINRSYDNIIGLDGITLTNGWHPIPDRKVLFQLSGSVPKGFTAISETDHFSTQEHASQFSFSFSKPLHSIHFAAGPYSIDRLQVRDGLPVYTLFFEEDKQLAEEYLKKAVLYINRYEKEIGPFPYNHYTIVENRLPVGYGMDTFTLLGQVVIRLPFIKDTSLGHEILHSWFGNSIEVDYSMGNWCEGLTTYLSDQAFIRDQGNGPENRKASLINYNNYVREGQEIPLNDFFSASHNQPMAKSIRAVGYGRGAMLFHELKNMIGAKDFQKGLQAFYRNFKGKAASWDDIKQSFAAVSTMDLAPFFNERLSRKDIIGIKLENIDLTATAEKNYLLSFDIIQKTEKPFSFQLPLVVRTATEDIRFVEAISDKQNHMSLILDNNPVGLIIDPDYDLMRQLDAEETPPVLSHFFGAAEKLVVLESDEATELFRPLIERFIQQELTITTAKQVKNKDLADHSVLFLGTSSEASRALLAKPDHPETGFTLDVRKNPLNDNHVIILVTAASRDEVKAVSRKLPHYGKHSYLHFDNGKIQEKRTANSQKGIRIPLDRLPKGAATSETQNFQQIIEQLSTKQVVYIGESHTSLADHVLQFRIIEALANKNPNLVIGMEMFPHSSQTALDEYIHGDGTLTERQFLKKSRYFKVWRYDFRLFRPIFNFAVKNKIPVIGLNLEREVVSDVFKKGSTDELTEEQKNSIPVDRDLDMEGYADRLKNIHLIHTMTQKESGPFAGFIQSQALWDETMAETISRYLRKHTDTLMVVLAGSQHTRKDSGIPPRVARRIPVNQVSVLNISTNPPDSVAQQADYYFLAGNSQLSKKAKIGVLLNPIERENKKYLQISKISSEGNAEKAGLQVDDIIVAIDDFPISEMEDVNIAMLDATAGQEIKVTVRRGDIEDGEELLFQVQLHNLGMHKKQHP